MPSGLQTAAEIVLKERLGASREGSIPVTTDVKDVLPLLFLFEAPPRLTPNARRELRRSGSESMVKSSCSKTSLRNQAGRDKVKPRRDRTGCHAGG